MAKAVFFSFPAYGHLTPALPVVAELVRRGEEVVVFATGRSRARVEATGASFRLYDQGHDAFSPTPATAGLFNDMPRLLMLAEELLPGLLEAVAGEAPDYVLLDTKSVWGRLVAQVVGLPAVTMSVVFAIMPELIRVSDLVNMLYARAPQTALVAGMTGFAEYLEIARRIDGRYGTRCPGLIEFLGNPQPLNIVFTSRAFQLEGDRFGAGYAFVGPSMPQGRDQAVEFPFDLISGDPLVYVSLGTTFNDAPEFYRDCFDAFGDAPWQVVLSTGGLSLEGLGTPPENIILRQFVPQIAILERADVCVTHGGMGSVNEALYHDVPLVVVPQRGDQFLVAARVEELGAGIAIPPGQVTADVLRNAVNRVMIEASYRTASRRLGTSLREAGGAARGAELILSRSGT